VRARPAKVVPRATGRTRCVFVLLAVVAATLLGATSIPSHLAPIALASAVASGALYYAGAYWFYLGALRRVARHSRPCRTT
jgi:hypothetical protein